MTTDIETRTSGAYETNFPLLFKGLIVAGAYSRFGGTQRSRIGKYEILGELGRGGFGQVFLGYDPAVNREVAIKVLSADGDTNSVRRFKAEAAAAGSLRHKNIVTIYEFGEDQGTFFIVMEYLDGRDLGRDKGATSTMSIFEKVRIMTEVAEGLQCAHQNGIVHRDVKPANIMILKDGSVKVMDFGIARFASGSTAHLTASGFLVGSVFYMSPEQLKGQEADARADIWAFGVILYEILAGRHPFEAHDTASAMFHIASVEPTPVMVACPDCPTALASVVSRLLQKNRGLRYQSFEDVLFDLVPIALELERSRADTLANEAAVLLEKGDLDSAAPIIKHALVLDPMHARGRALRQQLQTAIQKRSARNQIEALVKQGDRLVEAKNYKDAIESFETALTLDPLDSRLRSRINDIRRAQERANLAAGLVTLAVQHLKQDNLSAALRQLHDALSAEPDNADAQRLFDDVRKRIATREEDRRIADALTKANGLLELQAFDDGIAILEKLHNELPNVERVSAALASARTRREDESQERAIQKEMVAARAEIRAGRLDAAITRLDELSKNAQATSKAANLLAYARNEQAAERKARIEEALADAEALRKGSGFEDAVARLDSTLLFFPDESDLIQLRRTLALELEQQRRDAFIQAAIDDAIRLNREDRAADACAVLDRALLKHPNEARLSAALIATRDAISRRDKVERQAALDRDLAQARTWISEGNIDAAAKLIEQLRERAPDDPRVSDLSRRVQADSERRRAIELACAEAQRCLDLGQVEEAGGILARAKDEHEATPKFLALEAAVAKAHSHKQLLDRARAAMENDDLRAASAILQELLRLSGEDAEVQALHLQVNQGLEGQERQRRLTDERAKARNLIESQRFTEAIRCLRALQTEFPGHPEIAGDLERALVGLEKQSEDAATAREAEETQRRTQDAIREGRERAAAMRRAGDLTAARSLLEDLCKRYPNQPDVIRDRNEVLRKIEIDFVNQTLARITDHQRAQNWDAAFAEAEIALAAYPDNATLREIAAEERKRKAATEAVLEIRAAIATLDWSSASKKLKDASVAFPGEKVFLHLQEEFSRARIGATLSQLAADVESCLERSDWNGALNALERNAALAREPRWKALEEKLNLYQNYAKALADAEDFAGHSEYVRAEGLLKEVITNAPDTRAAALLRSISIERVRKERDDAVARTRREVDQLVQKGNFQEGLGLLDRACKQLPDDLSLAELRNQIEARFEEQRREEQRSEDERAQTADRARKLASCRISVESAAAAADWQNAFSLLDRADQDFPAEPSLPQLRKELTQHKTRRALDELKRAVQQRFDKRDLAGAARLLAANQADLLNEPEWRELEQELLRRRQYYSLVGEAEDLIIHANYDAAKSKLRQAIALGPGLSRANALLKDIEANEGVRTSFKLKVRLMIRKRGKLIRRAGIGAGVLATMGLAAYVWRLVQPAPVLPSPTQQQLNFAYREGAPNLPAGKLDFPPTRIDFQVSTEENWLEVQPQTGSQLKHLQVRVTRALNPGEYTTTLVIHPLGRSRANAILVPVHLEVTGGDHSSKPVRLKLDADRVIFDYTLDQPTPRARKVGVVEGDVRDASRSADWVQVSHTKKSVEIAPAPRGLASMAAGEHDTVVTVEPADTGSEPALIQVRLIIRPSLKSSDSGRPANVPKQSEPPTLPAQTPLTPGPTGETNKPPEIGKAVESAKAPPPPAPGCETGVFGGDKGNTFLWEGNLEPGQTVEFRHYWASTGKVGLGTPPDRRVLKILSVDPPGIDQDRVPTIENGCNYLRLRNSTSSPVHSLKVQWQWVEKAK